MFEKLSVYLTKKNILWTLLGLAICSLTYFYFLYRDYYPSTDDAYIQANVVHIAAQVSGPVAQVFVENNQLVKAGEVLFTIDPRPFQTVLDRSQAAMKQAWQQMSADVEAIHVAEALVNQAKAQSVQAEKNYKRISTLVTNKQLPISNGDDAKAQLDVTHAELLSAQNRLREAAQKLGDVGGQNSQILLAKSNVEEAELNLGYTKVFAPADGYVTNFELRKGTMVIQNRPLFQLVESHHWWVYANYKETELDRIKPGQKASIQVDMYPDHTFEGIVDSVSRGSGAAFSLLPPENATGNWVKITQRFPVKVIFTQVDPKLPLRVGASCTVTIDTIKQKI